MERVAIIDGVRTPFVKAGGAFANLSALELASEITRALVNREAVKGQTIDEFVFGSVLLDARMPNLAREILFKSALDLAIPAHFVSNNCISGLLAASQVARGIASREISTGIAGGVESMSQPALAWKPAAEKFFLRLSRARSMGEKIAILSGFRPSFCVPIPPSPKEPSTGLTMGEHCELMAKEFSIARADQDQFAFESHQNASRAIQEGIFDSQIIPMAGVTRDLLVRADTSREKLAKLKPVFDRSGSGTITAGNASALTDGAAALFLSSQTRAAQSGLRPIGFIEAIEFAALPPDAGLLMAPVFAVPKLLQRAGLTISEIDLFEIHEAFSAQVLANLSVWEHGWKRFPELKPIGKIPREKINCCGGSVAIGHPFAATGGRLIIALARELERRKLKRGLISICAAGGMAGAVLISRE